MASLPQPPQKPKRRIRLQFSLRAFLIVATLIGIILAPWITRTRQQMRVCDQLKSVGIFCELNEPPQWLLFLPTTWLNASGGHWCRSAKRVLVTSRTGADPLVRLANIKKLLELVAQLPRLQVILLDLRNLEVSSDQLADCLAVLRQVNALQEINVETEQTDLFVSTLPALPHLRSLRVQDYGTGITDQGLEQISKFPGLQTLNVDGRLLLGQSLKTVASLKNLKNATFEGAAFTSSDLECFANHPTLESLITMSSVDDDAVRTLASCPNLRAIILSNSSITDVALAYLRNSNHLKEIHLDGTQITDTGFANLAHCKSLTNIVANNCKLSDSIGSTLAQLPNLQTLQLDRTFVTGKLLPGLTHLNNLTALMLPKANVDVDSVVAFISDDPHRSEVDWERFGWQQAYYHFGNGPNQPAKSSSAYLDLSNLQGISGRINRVRDLAMVTDANLAGTDIGDNDLQALASACNLERLDVSQTANLTPKGFQFLKNQTGLISLRAGPFDNALESLQAIESISSLTILELLGMDRLTDSDIASIGKLQNLTSLKIYGCEPDPTSVNLLCQLPKLKGIVWGRKSQYDAFHIENARLQHARQTIGIPFGFQSRIPALNAALRSSGGGKVYYSSHTPIIIADERELPLLSQTGLRSLSAANVRLTTQGATALLLHTGVDGLDLSNTGVRDEVLKISAFKNYTSLILDNNPITDASVETLIHFKNLQHLSLANTRISDIGVSRLLQTLELQTLNLSGTNVTAQAWSRLHLDKPPVAQELNLTGVTALPEILPSIPKNLLSRYTIINRDGTTVDDRSLSVLRKEIPDLMLESIQISPELLKVWSARELLHGKTRVSKLHLCGTLNVAEILQVAARECPRLGVLELKNESLDSPGISLTIPQSVGVVAFENCVVSTPVLESIAACHNLKMVHFSACELKNCSLESLQGVASLVRLTREKTELTIEQLQTWKTIQSTLQPSE